MDGAKIKTPQTKNGLHARFFIMILFTSFNCSFFVNKYPTIYMQLGEPHCGSPDIVRLAALFVLLCTSCI